MFTIIGGDGKEYGPVELERLREWIAQNRANLNTHARRDGGPFKPLREHPEFAPPPAPTETTAAAPGPAPAAPALPEAASFATEFAPPPPPPPGAVNAPGAAPGPFAAPPPEPIEFSGEWKEYFKIWIVNVLLTVATLGIYAAWAKVRKRRYFYANTRVCGHAFEYLADPVKILVGNLIVTVLFALYLGSQINPVLYLLALGIVALLTPWFVVRAHAFNARNTAWRGLRFNFRGHYGDAAGPFLGWPLLLGCTMGLLYPLVTQKQREFIMNHHTYGAMPFHLRTTLGDLFKAFFVAALFFLPIVFLYIGFFVLIAVSVARSPGGGGPPEMLAPFYFVLLALVALCTFVGTQVWRARVFNIVWNGATIGGTSFIARMRARDLIRLQLANVLLTLVTCGLLHPWGVVRKMRFQLSCLQIVPAGNLDAFVAESQAAGSAVGDAAGDLFDFDIGFGV